MPSTSLIEPRVFVAPTPVVPWWRVGVMWLVVGGLGVVVIASFMLLATAVRHADTVVPYAVVRSAPPGQPDKSVTPNPSAQPSADPSERPAMQARNHAATPAP